MNNSNTRAIEAARILSLLGVDLTVGTRSLDIFNKILIERPWGMAEHGMIRMCHYHFLFALGKFAEFYKYYRAVIPKDCRDECKKICRQINQKGVVEFRNKYLGHILNSHTGRPLDARELENYLQRIYGESVEGFIAWINDHKNVFPSTVTSVVERAQKRIMETHSLSGKDIALW